MSDEIHDSAALATRGLLGTLAFILIMIGLELLFYERDSTRHILGWSLIGEGIVCTYAAVIWNRGIKWRVGFVVVAAASASTLWILNTGGRWPFSPRTFVGQMVPLDQKLVLNQLTLQSALHDNFPGTFQTAGEVPWHDRDGTTISVQSVDFRDPHNGAEFLGFYIPATSHTVDITKAALNEYKQIMEALAQPKNIMSIIGKGEHGSNTTSNTRFTGRIFVYHEQLLSAQELKEIDDLAAALDVNVVLRDPSYLSSR